MSELADSLSRRGFRAIDNAGLPGGWATDGEWTVVIQSRLSGGGFEHTVTVYDCPAGLISIESEPAATAIDSSHAGAVRRALRKAGYESDESAERKEPTRSEPADFGHGESTGVQDL